MTTSTPAAVGQTITGTAFGDKLTGGAGDDILRGLGGADTLDGGGGADRIFWTRGDGSDLVEGGAGADTQFMVGNAFNIGASGNHTLVSDFGETLNLHGVEAIQAQSQGGAISSAIGDLSGTDVRQVVLQLDALDAATDLISVSGGSTADTVSIQVASATSLRILDGVNGVTQTTVISGLDAADTVNFSGGGGNDNIAVTTPHDVAVAASISVHGNDGADTLTGSIGAERLFGDAGNDVIKGGAGDDTIDAGTGSDIIDGGAGRDTQTIVAGSGGLFADIRGGANGHVDEQLGVLNQGVDSHVDAVNVETIAIQGAAGQQDFIAVGFFSTTSVRFVDADFGVGGQRDFFLYDATNQADTITVGNLNGSTDIGIDGGVTGFGAAVHHIDGTDGIEIDAFGGDDLIDLRGLNFGGDVLVDGDSGNDHMIAGFGRAEFVFNVGLQASDHDVIDNFKDPNPSVHHVIRLVNFVDSSLEAMKANHHIIQEANGDVLLLGSAGSTLTLTHTTLATLTDNDFNFFI